MFHFKSNVFGKYTLLVVALDESQFCHADKK